MRGLVTLEYGVKCLPSIQSSQTSSLTYLGDYELEGSASALTACIPAALKGCLVWVAAVYIGKMPQDKEVYRTNSPHNPVPRAGNQ